MIDSRHEKAIEKSSEKSESCNGEEEIQQTSLETLPKTATQTTQLKDRIQQAVAAKLAAVRMRVDSAPISTKFMEGEEEKTQSSPSSKSSQSNKINPS
jgi:hypothetical protein